MRLFSLFEKNKDKVYKNQSHSHLLGNKEDYFRAKDTTPCYFVYIIECLDGSYYTGYTEDLPNRIIQHKMGNGAEYTKENGFKRLVYFESHSSEKYAKRREYYIKKAGRIYRESLVTEFQKNLMLLQISV